MTITLAGEDLENFNKMYQMLDEIEDVREIYHNVENVSYNNEKKYKNDFSSFLYPKI